MFAFNRYLFALINRNVRACHGLARIKDRTRLETSRFYRDLIIALPFNRTFHLLVAPHTLALSRFTAAPSTLTDVL